MKLTGVRILNKIVISLSFLFALVFISCNSNNKHDNKKSSIRPEKEIAPSILVKNITINSSENIKGKVVYSTIKNVSFVNSGKLEKGDVPYRIGTYFKFNDLLAKLNFEEVFQDLTKNKLLLSKKVKVFEEQLEKTLPSELKKWQKFDEGLIPVKRLPEFPNIYSEAEKALIIDNDIFILFSKIKNQENEIEQDFYLAPFDGIILGISKQPNELVKSNETIMKIAKKDFFNGEFIVPLALFSKHIQTESVEFYDNHDTKIGSGEFKKAIRNDGQMKVIFSFKKEKGIRISNNQNISFQLSYQSIEGCYIPKEAFHGGIVVVLSNGKEIKTKVKILKEQNEQVFVSGLKDGSIVLIK